MHTWKPLCLAALVATAVVSSQQPAQAGKISLKAENQKKKDVSADELKLLAARLDTDVDKRMAARKATLDERTKALGALDVKRDPEALKKAAKAAGLDPNSYKKELEEALKVPDALKRQKAMQGLFTRYEGLILKTLDGSKNSPGDELPKIKTALKLPTDFEISPRTIGLILSSQSKPSPPPAMPNPLQLVPPYSIASTEGQGASADMNSGRISATSGTYFVTAAYNRATVGTAFRVPDGMKTVSVEALVQGFSMLNGGCFLGGISGQVTLDLSVSGDGGSCQQSITLMEVHGSWACGVNEVRNLNDRVGCSFTRADTSSKPYAVQVSVSSFASSIGLVAFLTALGDFTVGGFNARFAP